MRCENLLHFSSDSRGENRKSRPQKSIRYNLLDPRKKQIPMTGTQSTHPPSIAGKQGFSLISDDKFRQLYAALLQCGMLDQRLRAMAGYEPWMGREASAAAVTACLRRGDTITATPRGTLASYLHYGFIASAGKARNPQAQLLAANQDALSNKLKKLGNIAVVFAPTPRTAPTSAMFAAAARQLLPVLYVLEGGTHAADSCEGIPVIRVEASDTVAFYRVAYESVTRAREAGGPTIIECAPWPGDPHPPDPLLKLEQYLACRRLFRPHWRRQLQRKYAGVIDQAVSSIPQ